MGFDSARILNMHWEVTLAWTTGSAVAAVRLTIDIDQAMAGIPY